MATTLYWIISPASGWVTPTGPQIVAGQNGSGGAATATGSEPYTAAGTYTEATPPTTLAASTSYRSAWVAYDGTSYGAVQESAAAVTLPRSLCLVAGGLVQQASSPGDRRIYLQADGSLTASAAAAPPGRLVALSAAGQLEAA